MHATKLAVIAAVILLTFLVSVYIYRLCKLDDLMDGHTPQRQLDPQALEHEVRRLEYGHHPHSADFENEHGNDECHDAATSSESPGSSRDTSNANGDPDTASVLTNTYGALGSSLSTLLLSDVGQSLPGPGERWTSRDERSLHGEVLSENHSLRPNSPAARGEIRSSLVDVAQTQWSLPTVNPCDCGLDPSLAGSLSSQPKTLPCPSDTSLQGPRYSLDPTTQTRRYSLNKACNTRSPSLLRALHGDHSFPSWREDKARLSRRGHRQPGEAGYVLPAYEPRNAKVVLAERVVKGGTTMRKKEKKKMKSVALPEPGVAEKSMEINKKKEMVLSMEAKRDSKMNDASTNDHACNERLSLGDRRHVWRSIRFCGKKSPVIGDANSITACLTRNIYLDHNDLSFSCVGTSTPYNKSEDMTALEKNLNITIPGRGVNAGALDKEIFIKLAKQNITTTFHYRSDTISPSNTDQETRFSSKEVDIGPIGLSSCTSAIDIMLANKQLDLGRSLTPSSVYSRGVNDGMSVHISGASKGLFIQKLKSVRGGNVRNLFSRAKVE